jgi:hypothetical protein
MDLVAHHVANQDAPAAVLGARRVLQVNGQQLCVFARLRLACELAALEIV